MMLSTRKMLTPAMLLLLGAILGADGYEGEKEGLHELGDIIRLMRGDDGPDMLPLKQKQKDYFDSVQRLINPSTSPGSIISTAASQSMFMKPMVANGQMMSINQKLSAQPSKNQQMEAALRQILVNQKTQNQVMQGIINQMNSIQPQAPQMQPFPNVQMQGFRPLARAL